MFEIVYDGRTTDERQTDDIRTPDHEYPISSPMSLRLRLAKKISLVNPSFTILIVGCKRVNITRTCFHDVRGFRQDPTQIGLYNH